MIIFSLFLLKLYLEFEHVNGSQPKINRKGSPVDQRKVTKGEYLCTSAIEIYISSLALESKVILDFDRKEESQYWSPRHGRKQISCFCFGIHSMHGFLGLLLFHGLRVYIYIYMS